MKICTKCGTLKNFSEFHKDRTHLKDGLASQCKVCKNRRDRERYNRNKLKNKCIICGDEIITDSLYKKVLIFLRRWFHIHRYIKIGTTKSETGEVFLNEKVYSLDGRKLGIHVCVICNKIKGKIE